MHDYVSLVINFLDSGFVKEDTILLLAVSFVS
jgi:hypothetical protein